MIIIYTSDERTGVKAAQDFAQKGYDNLYLLSGGRMRLVNRA